MSAPRQPSLARRRITALLRLLTVPLITVALHSVTRFPPWVLVLLGIVAAALVADTDFAVPGFRFLSRLNRVDRLAIWIVLVCLIVLGYLHNANTWTAERARLWRATADIGDLEGRRRSSGSRSRFRCCTRSPGSFSRTREGPPDSSSPASSRSTSISPASRSFSGAEMPCCRVRWSPR